ncbi:hypothetical protein SmJEL517_g00047 [Synchytrium microbalum]|uniref:Homeobox domain-containing protein n=1 Tax=Synchytrium microbalum TaxID=1806994 RepID=A0A507CFA1_9FUNG|nr:uncharacterized protein SmJEL517_g00047 [Synchytrium microbalum]TPX38038.1 hypothetical protein SmJEL517_g00047 [Synchytrium microbalum]
MPNPSTSVVASANSFQMHLPVHSILPSARPQLQPYVIPTTTIATSSSSTNNVLMMDNHQNIHINESAANLEGNPLLVIVRELLSLHKFMLIAIGRDEIGQVKTILTRLREILNSELLADTSSDNGQTTESDVLFRRAIAYLTHEIVNVSRPQQRQSPVLVGRAVAATPRTGAKRSRDIQNEDEKEYDDAAGQVARDDATAISTSSPTPSNTSKRYATRKLNKSERAFTRAVQRTTADSGSNRKTMSEESDLSPVDDNDDGNDDADDEEEFKIAAQNPSDDSDDYHPSRPVRSTRGNKRGSAVSASGDRPVAKKRHSNNSGSRPKPGPKRNSAGDGIVKRPNHSAEVSRVLKEWLFSHKEHPYPTDEEKDKLCTQTGLSITQCNNWFINARRRLLTPKNP